MAHSVFIDGEAGTTGLQIRQRLAGRSDLQLVSIDPARRKDPAARAELLNAVDVAILCLPDEGAREAVSLITNPKVAVVDPSTAHRVAPGWVFGFPEWKPGQRAAIAGSKRVSNPGCWSTGFIALAAPLVRAGLIPAAWPLTAHGISGYSGGGRGLIEEFEQQAPRDAYRIYGLNLAHKHLPEMAAYAGLERPPVFSPAVGRFAQGMIVEVPLALRALPGRPAAADLRAALAAAYAGERFVEVASDAECAVLQTSRAGAGGYVPDLDPEALNGTNRLRLFVFGNDARGEARLVALLDNLGKGASGAAVQNLNLVLGLEEGAGL
ncbi:N-acetyl-gamma-glutamyl-phosphate reductase [Phenylobacterium sp.]|jgi:N-acetyl-gamma-glutamyl-phosphate reductase|uniref:N-acetyl-gamma-glutamyl-phosphate reductase n=1 Tax=Phenylobacterium sp. TaxID=1871053 RepID=UPI002F425281